MKSQVKRSVEIVSRIKYDEDRAKLMKEGGK